MAQQNPSKKSPANPEPPAAPKTLYDNRYTVKPEFWDRVLDSIPPWGDEIAAIILIVFGIVSLLSLFNVSPDATISTAWSNALTSLFGFGSIVVSTGFLALGVLILLPKAGVRINMSSQRVLAIELAFLALLALLHLTTGDTEWRAIARAGQGGGIIGWGLSLLIGGPAGSTFAIFIYSLLFFSCVTYVLGVRKHHISRLLHRTGQRLRHYGERLAPAPAEDKTHAEKITPAAASAPIVEIAAPPPTSSGRRVTITRIRPDPAHIPPSVRAAIQQAKADVAPLTPLEVEQAGANPNRIVVDFNAIGELKDKKNKGDVQMVERPDGRVKRYFTVDAMAEPKKAIKRDPALPPLEILRDIDMVPPDEAEINTNVVLIENTLLEFDIDVDVVDVKVGPTVTQYAVQPFKERAGGEGGEPTLERTRISKIASLASDLSLSLAAKRLRLETPVPGHSYVGIEVPNKKPSVVTLRSIYESRYFQELMLRKKSPLLVPLGRDVTGLPVAIDLAQMPHLLIAGTTGSGKSVAIAALATALIMNNTPDLVKLVLLDPKMVELSRFNGLPHLIGPVETDQERIIGVLRWCTREMDRRYKLLEEAAVRNIETYNARLGRRQQDERLPYMVIMIDEIGDLMLSQPEETERTITRLAQKARAAGMHLVIATQRPSVDVITGLIKANFPSRISFAVASGIDSRVILDSVGAETLLGRGDMLYLANDAAGPRRVQGCFISDDEVRNIVTHWKVWSSKQIDEGKLKPNKIGPWERGLTRRELLAETDPMLEEAIALVIAEGEASASLIQRKMGLGYPRAARLIDLMHELRVIGPQEVGGRSRRVLIKPGEDPFKEEIDKRSSSK